MKFQYDGFVFEITATKKGWNDEEAAEHIATLLSSHCIKSGDLLKQQGHNYSADAAYKMGYNMAEVLG